MRVQDLPPPSRFMFWCLAPILIPTLIAFPFLTDPRGVESWILMFAIELSGLFTLFGFYDHVRYNWCLRVVGAIVFLLYLAYLASTVMSGPWIGNGRQSGATAINAFIGWSRSDTLDSCMPSLGALRGVLNRNLNLMMRVAMNINQGARNAIDL